MASCSQVNSLFQAYIDGELGDAEKGILEVHLRECGACRKELAGQQASNAKIFEALSDQRLVWGVRSRVLAHLPEMDAAPKYASHPTDPRFSTRKHRSQLPWLLAGVAAVLVIVGLALFQRSAAVQEEVLAGQREVAGMVIFGDGVGTLRESAGVTGFHRVELKNLVRMEDRYQTLAEGRLALALVGSSIVKVNYDSALRVVDNRRVQVEQGLTYFDIGHHKRHFYVDTPAGEIQVFGTAFVVDATPAKTTVTVTEGDILVRNDDGIAAVSHGNQLTFTRTGPMPTPVKVNVGPIVAWADAIVPDPAAMALFRQTLDAGVAADQFIPAEPALVVPDLSGLEVYSLLLEWVPEETSDAHCSYIIHVSDGMGDLKMLSSIEHSIFDTPGIHSLKIEVPDGPIQGVNLLQIKLIPDCTDGEHDVVFTEISAIVSSR